MFTKKSIFRLFLVLIAVLLMSSTVSARPLAEALGTSFTYQGRLTDGGVPATGTYDLEFKLYDALTDGVLVGTEPLEDVIVSGGLFTVQLDFGPVFDGRVLYLQIGVRPGTSTGAYTPLAPRQPLSSAPYAQYALTANDCDRLEGQQGTYYQNASNINAGTLGNSFFDAYLNLNGAGRLGDGVGDIPLNNGSLNATLNADLLDGHHITDFVLSGHNHWGGIWSGTGTGLDLGGGTTGLLADGTDYGVYGTGTGADSIGVYGGSSNATGYGVFGYSNLYTGVHGTGLTGVSGFSNAVGGYGVYGLASGGANQNYAGYFDGNVQINGRLNVSGSTNISADMLDGLHASAFADAIHNHWGQTWTGTGTGLTLDGTNTGITVSGNNYGIYASSTNYGVYGTGTSRGVWGNSTGDNSIAVYATASGANSNAVYGVGPNGVYGYSNVSGGYGIHGYASGGVGTNYAGYFDGNVQVNGSLNVTGTTNINADRLDSFHAGNAAGNIPVSNGTLNATLNADLLDGMEAASFASASHTHWGGVWSGSGTGLTLNGSNEGIHASGTNYGVYGSGNYGVYGTGDRGVWGHGTTYGVYADSTGTGSNAIYGVGPNGIYGYSNNPGGYAIHGWASGGPNNNFAGYFDGNVQINGSLGITSPALVTNLNADLLDGNHAAAFALVSHNHQGATWTGGGTGLTLNGGLIGLSGSGSTYGLYGTSTGGGNYGVYGTNTTGTGVYGTGINGVTGYSNSSGYGVFGTGTGTGVYGTTTTGGNKAIWGVASGGANNNWAGYFEGNVSINGRLSLSDITNLNADLLDGRHAANTIGSIPISNGTLNVTLNADLLDGLNTGNANGNIPTNNGTMNANLNADMLDGYHAGNPSGSLALNNTVLNVDLNADRLDNLHASNATGNIPISNGTVNTSLNADRLDGFDAGNASGNVPVSNTTLNTNLNADMLDGLHSGSFAAFTHSHWGQTWSGAGIGLTLNSNGDTGLYATGNYMAIRGESPTTGYIGVYGYGPDGVFAQSNKADGNAIYAQAYNSTSSAGYFQGNVSVTGNLTVSGTKSAVVDTQDYGSRTLYAVESPESWFEDFGTGQLVNGTVVIPIEPIFAQTVNLSEDYHVFLTPNGDCSLFVDAKTPTSFTVKAIGGGTCSIAFDYRVVAKRLGYEDTRLAEVDNP